MMSTCKHDGGRPGRVVNLGIRIDWTCWKNTLQFSRCLKFCWCSLGYCLWLGGGNSNIFWNFHPDPWRNDPNWYFYFHSPSYIFVRWVGKQPPTSLWCLSWSKSTLFKTPAFFSTPLGGWHTELQPSTSTLKETTRTTWRVVVSHCWHLQRLPQVLYHMTLGSYRWLLRWQRGGDSPCVFCWVWGVITNIDGLILIHILWCFFHVALHLRNSCSVLLRFPVVILTLNTSQL